ncbi:MAG TPA: DegT/DnrJ/EryC1/StrS family aminotransferase [Terriglobia bacterium]|nr:DegT/DnrJ/EryC1/StrS family aminotransferase [Terriglobia bacterium]
MIKTMVPFLNLAREYERLRDEIEPAVQRVLAGGHYILGPEVHEFERRFTEYCGVPYGAFVGSGTDGLMLGLQASGMIRPGTGDEVITSAHGSPYTALAIFRAGARPVFADIDPQTWLLTPETIERAVTPRTRAIVPVHLYGLPCDMKGILEIARQHGLVVIEDACQAQGARLRDGEWRRAGSFGLAAAFSFYPTKNLGCFGDAGFILSSDRDLIDRARLLARGGQRMRDLAAVPGYNSRGDEIQAAILNCKLPHLEEWNQRRRTLAALYKRLLQLPGLQLQHVPEGTEHIFHLFVVRHRLRNQLRAHLHDRGIETMTHYPVALHRQPAFADTAQANLPEAERAADEVLSLPLQPSMSEAEVEDVANAVNEFLPAAS